MPDDCPPAGTHDPSNSTSNCRNGGWRDLPTSDMCRMLDLLPHLRLRREPLYERNALVWNEDGSSTAAATMGIWLETSYGDQPEVAARLEPRR